MLLNTFLHLQGIGETTERLLWENGVPDWAAAMEASPPRGRGIARLRRGLEESRRRLAAGDADFFYRALPVDQQWRIFAEFRGAAAYLDIETTGLGGPDDYITTIATYDGKTVKYYIHSENLEDFRRDIQRYQVIITYNGKCFDVPFIQRCLGAQLPAAHIDLRYVLASLGYRGGLKGVERRLGMDRGELAGLDGFFAVLLWRDYRNGGNRKALETLLAYNIVDVVNLEQLMVTAYNLKLQNTPFAGQLSLPAPAAPGVPFHADAATIRRLRGSLF